MKTKLPAALCALLMMAALLALPAPALGEMLDLSQFAGGEPPAAEEWEDAVFDTRAWYERADADGAQLCRREGLIITEAPHADGLEACRALGARLAAC